MRNKICKDEYYITNARDVVAQLDSFDRVLFRSGFRHLVALLADIAYQNVLREEETRYEEGEAC